MPVYMLVEGVQGTGTGTYQGWIELQSCIPGTLGPAAPKSHGSRDHLKNDITVTKYKDQASDMLVSLLIGQKYVDKVKIDFVKSGRARAFRKFLLEKVVFTSVRLQGEPEDSSSLETWTLNFEKLTYSFDAGVASVNNDNLRQKALWSRVGDYA